MHTLKDNTHSQTHCHHTIAQTHTNKENNLFFKKRQEQMIQIKRAKLRVGMCLHSLTTF